MLNLENWALELNEEIFDTIVPICGHWSAVVSLWAILRICQGIFEDFYIHDLIVKMFLGRFGDSQEFDCNK